jgi:DNA-binding PadR family transcriptional regulator
VSLPHVLLGLLARPASGYELGQVFGQSVRHFWSAELSQIYPALARLEKDGLLISHAEPSDKGPPKKIYRRTRAGTRALRLWLEDGPIVRTERTAYLTQVFFLDEVNVVTRIKFLEALRDDFAAHLAELNAIEAEWKEEDPHCPDQLPDEELFKHMTLRLGLVRYEATVRWCEECVDRLRARSASPSS